MQQALCWRRPTHQRPRPIQSAAVRCATNCARWPARAAPAVRSALLQGARRQVGDKLQRAFHARRPAPAGRPQHLPAPPQEQQRPGAQQPQRCVCACVRVAGWCVVRVAGPQHAHTHTAVSAMCSLAGSRFHTYTMVVSCAQRAAAHAAVSTPPHLPRPAGSARRRAPSRAGPGP
jgi:hypothetical protein